MLTYDRQIKNNATYVEMKSATSFQEKQSKLQRLGGNITGCIARLKNLYVEIQSQTDLRRIAIKMTEYQKVNRQYNKLQDSLAEIDDNSELYEKIIKINRQFIQTYDASQLKKKMNFMAAQRNQHIRNSNLNQMSYVNQTSLQGELLYQDKFSIKKRIIQQEKQELKEIQRILTQINDIADQTFNTLERTGEVIKVGLEKMRSAHQNTKKTKENMAQANEYQQDTNKKFIIFCCLTVVIVSIIVLIIYASSSKGQ